MNKAKQLCISSACCGDFTNLYASYLFRMACYEFKGVKPVVAKSSFVHPLAAVTGNVVIGENVYIGPGAAIRGDFGKIIISDGCNVQENCTIHMFPGATVYLQENAHIGHGAVVHGANIGANCLIGMNAVILDDVELGEESIVSALTLVKAGEKIPKRSLVVGNPGKVIRKVSEEMLSWKTEGTAIYQQLVREVQHSFKECKPLRKLSKKMLATDYNYETWGKRKAKSG